MGLFIYSAYYRLEGGLTRNLRSEGVFLLALDFLVTIIHGQLA